MKTNNKHLQITITEVDYEMSRLDYFCELRKTAYHKMQYWSKIAKNSSYLSMAVEKASNYGAQVNYLDDVVKMLMDKIPYSNEQRNI